MARSQSRVSRLVVPVNADDHVQGPADAPATLVEYGDYECPYCGAAYPIVKEIQKRLGGRLRFAFRHFPLSQSHPHALRAAEAAEAAGAQGRFWEMHDLLYENQQALGEADLLRHAGSLGLDLIRFKRELTSNAWEARIRKEFMSGVRSGVNGTPTFFINGVRYDGAWDAETLLEALTATAHVPAG